MFPTKAQQTQRHTAYANWHRSILAVAIGQLVFGFIIAINNSAYAGNKVRSEEDRQRFDPGFKLYSPSGGRYRRDIPSPVEAPMLTSIAPPSERTLPPLPDNLLPQHGDLVAARADQWSEYAITGISYPIIVGLFGVVNGVFGIGGIILCGGNKSMLLAHFIMSFVVSFQAAYLCVGDIILIDRAAAVVNRAKITDTQYFAQWDQAQKGVNKYAAMVWLNMFSKFMLAICALISAGFVSVMWVEGVTAFHEIFDDQQAPSAVVVAPHGPPPPPMPPQPQQYPPRTPPQQSPRRMSSSKNQNRDSVGSHSSGS